MYIITGGAGFIGSVLVAELNNRGHSDILIVDNLGKNAKWKNLVKRQYLDYLHKDTFIRLIREDKFKDKYKQEPNAIIHLGACSCTTEDDADYLFENNFKYSRDLFLYTQNRQNQFGQPIRFIQASSAATYGDGSTGFSDSPENTCNLMPLNMYGYSKHLFDLWAMRNVWTNNKYTNNLVSLKFFNVFGPNEYHKGSMQSLVCKAVEQIQSSDKLKLFRSNDKTYLDGEQKRDFIYVKDCAKVICWLLEHPEINGLFNLGTGLARTWLDLAAAIFKSLNMPRQIEYIDMPLNLLDKYQNFTQADMSKLFTAGLPAGIFQSLEQTVADYVQNYLCQKDKYL